MDLHSIASEINLRAMSHPIGKLQEIRKELKGLKRLTTQKIFSSLTTKKEWAFHHGGRKEIQFNIGIEHPSGVDELRYGIAFSLETSRSLTSIEILIPKVILFNEFMQLYSEKFSDLLMWHFTRAGRSVDYFPTAIPNELVAEGAFIFLGDRQPTSQLDYELILDVFDRLLPLYKYVESNGTQPPITTTTITSFDFQPRIIDKAESAVMSTIQRELDINLRHNILQKALAKRLAETYGKDNVSTELPSGVGTLIDVVVKQNTEYWFYEIKTGHSSRACLRQAIGQLLEYTFWPGAQEATRLIVVGESPLDDEGSEYLRTLRERFSLPIEYEQIAEH